AVPSRDRGAAGRAAGLPAAPARRARSAVGSGVPARAPHGGAAGPLSTHRRAARLTVLVLVDSHCHVAEPEFDTDRDAVLARAAAKGVTTIVCVGAPGAVERTLPAAGLAGRREPVEIVATVGIHPHDASTADEQALATLERLARAPGVV